MGKGDTKHRSGKGGRPTKPGARYPSGQRVEPIKPKDLSDVGREARQRVYGLSKEDAAKVQAETAVGRLYLSGEPFSFDQWEACELYREIHREYGRAVETIKIKSPSLLRIGGYDASDGTDPAYVEWYERTKGRYNRARHVVLMEHEPLAQLALDGWVLDNTEMWPHVGPLRIAANALWREFEFELQQREDAA